MRYPVVMGRTFVNVELRDRSAIARFASAMNALGFVQIVKGRKKGNALRLPKGMFILERATPVRALELARRAIQTTNVQARVFCVPATDEVRFGNLRPCAA